MKIKTLCGLKYKLSERMNQLVMRWYERMGNMSREKLVKRIKKAEVETRRRVDFVLDGLML